MGKHKIILLCYKETPAVFDGRPVGLCSWDKKLYFLIRTRNLRNIIIKFIIKFIKNS